MAEFSGGIQIGSGQWDKYSLILRINEISYSVENNTSYVEWWVGIRSNTQYHEHNGISETFKVSVNGTQVLNQSFTPNVPVNTLVGVKSGAVTISHDADGSKTISVSASFSGSNPGYYAPITGSCSGTVKLTTIPRASSISIDSPSIECGNTININGSSASKNFTHKIYATWNGKTSELVTIASGTTTPSFSYTIPTSWEKDLPNSTSGIATFTLETFSGSNSVGSKSVNATIKVRSGVVPSIGTVSISDTNSICTGIGQYVQSQSRLKFSIATSGSQGSTVTSVSTKFEGQTYNSSSFTTGTVQGSGTLSYVITITDSRGRTASKSGSVTVSAYSSPSLTNVTARRANSSYTVDEASGTYALLHFKVGFTSLTGNNATSFYIQYRASGASSWTKINSWDNNYSLEQDYKAGNLFTSATSSYEVAFGVKDSFMSDYSWKVVTVTPTYTLINFGKDGKSLTFFGQDGNSANTLTINGDLAINSVKENTSSTKLLVANGSTVMYRDWNKLVNSIKSAMYPVGSVYITYNNVNPGTFLGGTWERFGQGRTLVGEGTGNDGSTSMSFTANSTGGSYKHNHIYGIKVNEYYSVTSNLRVRKSDGSWQGGIRDGTGHAYFNNCSQAGNKELNTDTYKIESNTSNSGTIQPYIVVFFWRRTA
ncbi:DUF859 family phage minor structural protein [Holdemanella porci]|uniref:DUF859 family phage minor structural protein n=1 Tax=Holdemanella porci TaxID=2652276 RepID=UPI0022E761CA|nr:DUF859 family phage minor structural protein [Holdemanella porci]